jgi:hypothetical protein
MGSIDLNFFFTMDERLPRLVSNKFYLVFFTGKQKTAKALQYY